MLSFKEEKTVVENNKQRLDNIYKTIPRSTKLLGQIQEAYYKLEQVEEDLVKEIKELELKQRQEMHHLKRKPSYLVSDIHFFTQEYDKALLEEKL
jgi:hypothetical protein